ncbi:hypothetical protein EZV62_019349 [Acer yangbiense]|uniref:Uncharacterized protein n=1 Tax=Acer yangbiense TaxID=1000413 RepID=A0A5C7HA45_9ROSI|nr:hypothetical protein EZV62_019349 [Acer yangbiense]
MKVRLEEAGFVTETISLEYRRNPLNGLRESKISLLEELDFLERAIEELCWKEPKFVDKLSYKEQEVSLKYYEGLQSLLDTDNSRMLTELGHGTIFVGKTLVGDVAGLATISPINEKWSGCEEVHKIVQKDGEKIAGLHVIDESVRSSLKIEVIDDTALIESVQVPETGYGCVKDIGIEGTAKKIRWKEEEKKQESDEKKVKQSRRKAKDTKRNLETNERMKNMTPIMEDQDGGLKNGERSRKKYARQEMEAMRFVNVVEQRKLWRAIYTGLGLAVSNEYDELANSKQKNTLLNSDPRKCFPRKLESPGILSTWRNAILQESYNSNIGEYDSFHPRLYDSLEAKMLKAVGSRTVMDPGNKGRICFKARKAALPSIAFHFDGEGCSLKGDNELEYIEGYDVKNLNTGNSTCSHSTKVEDSVLEEKCSEDYDTDKDYASIQRPAFMVEGEPDFDSGPPEDGLEYLRRVRISGILVSLALCRGGMLSMTFRPAHIPKVKVSKLGGNKFIKEQSVYMPHIPNIAPCPEHLLPLKQWEDSFLADFSEVRQVMSGLENSSAQAAHNPESLLTFHKDSDSDGKISLCHQSPETCLNDDSSNYPTLSTLLKMDSVVRVSMLRKRIGSFETLSSLSRNDSVWLFALCATVDTPLDADTCAALQSLLRKCASLCAGKSELDDEVVMPNILAILSGRYFGQSED